MIAPLDLRNIKTEAISKKVNNTPATKVKAWFRIFAWSSPPIATKLRTLSEITGNTQGMRFKIRPPSKANMRAVSKDMLVADTGKDSFT